MKDPQSGALTLVGLLIVAVALGLACRQLAVLSGRVQALETRMDHSEEQRIQFSRALFAQASRLERADAAARDARPQTQPSDHAQKE